MNQCSQSFRDVWQVSTAKRRWRWHPCSLIDQFIRKETSIDLKVKGVCVVLTFLFMHMVYSYKCSFKLQLYTGCFRRQFSLVIFNAPVQLQQSNNLICVEKRMKFSLRVAVCAPQVVQQMSYVILKLLPCVL